MTRTRLNGERLWLTQDGSVVCEREGCAPQELRDILARLARTQGQLSGQGGTRYNVLNEGDLAEFAAILKAQHQYLTCRCGEVRYEPISRTLQTRSPVSDSKEGSTHAHDD